MRRSATMIIAAATVVVWALTALAQATDNAAVLMGFIPARFSGEFALSPAVPALLTPLSATLVHGGLLHILFNMLMLLWCGSAVERVLGRGALVLLYLVGAYVAALSQWAVDMDSLSPMIGASGAVSAVIGAFALSFGQPKRIVKSVRINRLLNAAWLLAAWVVLQLLLGMAAGAQGYLLATPAHIGGFLVGLVLQRPLLLWRYRGA